MHRIVMYLLLKVKYNVQNTVLRFEVPHIEVEICAISRGEVTHLLCVNKGDCYHPLYEAGPLFSELLPSIFRKHQNLENVAQHSTGRSL